MPRERIEPSKDYMPGESAVEALIDEICRFDHWFEDRLLTIRDRLWFHESHGTEARVFHFMGLVGSAVTPGWIAWRAGIDPSHATRILKLFGVSGFVTRVRCPRDGRQRLYELTEDGLAVARSFEESHRAMVRHKVKPLPRCQRDKLAAAMAAIREVYTRDPLFDLIDCMREERALKRARRRARRAAP
jgi:DNA-binding MarR family transcriptional regulator